ncbi:hypothetical protein PR048_027938 [Dryococelus australis]|uniref:Uncharacterized protein n=1 Tax=Dryococelus australis TaxID=614101 RepID=A0ABQ9GHU0_9NEOP|nr:hypothetical protein PR048_027938 [Dryococelus australis]
MLKNPAKRPRGCERMYTIKVIPPSVHNAYLPSLHQFGHVGWKDFGGSQEGEARCGGKRETPEKTIRPAASFGTIPACENPARRSFDGVRSECVCESSYGIVRDVSAREAVLRLTPPPVADLRKTAVASGYVVHNRSLQIALSCIAKRSPVHNVRSVVVTQLESRRATSCGCNSSHSVWHALYECLQDIHGDSSPFLLQPFHELSNEFWPHLTSPHPAIQFVPNMFYRVEVGALGGPVQSANIVVGVPLHTVSLLTSHQGEPGSIPGRVTPGFSRLGIVPDDATDWRVSSGISRFPQPFHSVSCSGLLLFQHYSAVGQLARAAASGEDGETARGWLDSRIRLANFAQTVPAKWRTQALCAMHNLQGRPPIGAIEELSAEVSLKAGPVAAANRGAKPVANREEKKKENVPGLPACQIRKPGTHSATAKEQHLSCHQQGIIPELPSSGNNARAAIIREQYLSCHQQVTIPELPSSGNNTGGCPAQGRLAAAGVREAGRGETLSDILDPGRMLPEPEVYNDIWGQQALQLAGALGEIPSGTRQENGVTGQQTVAAPFSNQFLEACLPASRQGTFRGIIHNAISSLSILLLCSLSLAARCLPVATLPEQFSRLGGCDKRTEDLPWGYRGTNPRSSDYKLAVLPLSNGGRISICATKILCSACGATVAERLARSPLTNAIRVQSPVESLQIFACGNRAGPSMQLVGGSSGGSPVSPAPFIPALLHTHFNHPQDLDVKSHPNLVTHILPATELTTCSSHTHSAQGFSEMFLVPVADVAGHITCAVLYRSGGSLEGGCRNLHKTRDSWGRSWLPPSRAAPPPSVSQRIPKAKHSHPPPPFTQSSHSRFFIVNPLEQHPLIHLNIRQLRRGAQPSAICACSWLGKHGRAQLADMPPCVGEAHRSSWAAQELHWLRYPFLPPPPIHDLRLHQCCGRQAECHISRPVD